MDAPGHRPHPETLEARLTALWRDSRSRQLAAIDTVIAHVTRTGHTGDPGTAAAIDAAHRLAGTLGIFGLPGCADAAHEIERALRTDDPQLPVVAADVLRAARRIRARIETHEIICAGDGELVVGR